MYFSTLPSAPQILSYVPDSNVQSDVRAQSSSHTASLLRCGGPATRLD